jgi:pimeloyl-ACP methyl ester carboxylesterase
MMLEFAIRKHGMAGIAPGKEGRMDEMHTPSGVRLRRRVARPGIGSESLEGLVDALDVPGSCWLVDLPGDGSNPGPPGTDPYALWPGVVLEAARALAPCVFVGHSTGGMYLLSVPELEGHLEGLVLVSSAPDASWHPRFVAMTLRNPLPAMAPALEAYQAHPDADRLRDLAVASAEWNFTPGSLARGRALLQAMPYNCAAVEWSDRCFDQTYVARWWPERLPTLILSGGKDRIVDQSLWSEPRFRGAHVTHRVIEGAAHFPWMERPEALREAFGALAARILAEEAQEGRGLLTP